MRVLYSQEFQAQDITPPRSIETVMGHYGLNLQVRFRNSVISDRPLRVVVYLDDTPAKPPETVTP